MDLTFQAPMQYYFLQHWKIALPFRSTTGYYYYYYYFFFALAPSLHSFWSYFSTLLQHIRHLTTQGIYLSTSYLFAFSYCLWGSQQTTKVVCHSLFQWTTFCQNSPPWHIVLGGSTWHRPLRGHFLIHQNRFKYAKKSDNGPKLITQKNFQEKSLGDSQTFPGSLRIQE